MIHSLPALALALLPAAAPPDAALGFPGKRTAEQRALEGRFDAAVRPEDMREWMAALAARPHPVNSAHGQANVRLMADLFRSWGYETRVEEFQVLFPTPRLRRLELLSPRPYVAKLEEPALAGDASSGQRAEQLPTYNAYSADGDVTAELVYVNHGVPRDYEELERRGIDVKGKIVIARYGGSWRGIKPKVAAERGAVGCLLYSDPRDDGFFQGVTYPDGPWRHEQGAQRGSVADMPLFPGDPLTPGTPAVPDAPRLARADAPTLARIPVLPISAADARPLLSALGGPVAPESWRGALPITYRMGPGPGRVRLTLAFNWDLVPARNVIAVMRGGARPDEWIVRGNHHDAWVNGASDPVSGLVALLAEAKAVGTLAASGWKPRRTLVYAAWDAEEPGLLGSTEWVEAHAEELRAHAVAYVNSDSNGRGFLSLAGSHTLERLVNEAAAEVPDPVKNVPATERVRALRILQASSAEERREVRERPALRLGALGSGSDYTPFLQHLGIASLDLGFGGENGGGSYHSIHDSLDHYRRFNDGDMAYGVALARVAGRAVLRLSEADVLPFEFTALADALDRYVREVARLADDLREDTEEHNRRIRENVFSLAADPRQPYVPPAALSSVPSLDFGPLQVAAQAVRESALRYERALAGAEGRAPARSEELDGALFRTERALTRETGLPGRPWFRHQVYAPGFYTGYGVKTLPGVRESIEQRDFVRAGAEIQLLARTLGGLASAIAHAAALLEHGGSR